MLVGLKEAVLVLWSALVWAPVKAVVRALVKVEELVEKLDGDLVVGSVDVSVEKKVEERGVEWDRAFAVQWAVASDS